MVKWWRVGAGGVGLLAAVWCAQPGAAATKTWDGGASGSSKRSWGAANNWDANTLPNFSSPGDDIIFATGFASGGGENTELDGNRTINSLTISTTTTFSINPGSGGILTLTSGNITRTSTGSMTFTAELRLGNSGTWDIQNGSVTVNSVISETGGSRSLTKTGAGTVTFGGSAANTYSGTTIVNAGELDLNKNAGVNAIAGNLMVGDGLGGVNADVVKLLQNNQIADSATLTINNSGKFDLNTRSDTIGTLAIQGGSLTGAGTLTVKSDYTNANFGSGNSFNAKGTGSGATINATINAAGTANQSITGSSVTSGTTATPTLTINVRPGVSGSQSFQVAYGTDATSPTLRGAIQTTGLNPAFTATATDFTLVNGTSTAVQSVGFNRATAGQTTSSLAIKNNFDNVQDQTLSLVGNAYDYAQATLGGSTIDFGNVHVGGGPVVRNATVTNTTITNPSFQDRLDGSASGSVGDITANGSFNNLAAGSSSAALTFTLNATTAGTVGGSKLLTLTSNNSLSGLDTQDLSQSVSFAGAAYHYAATGFAGATLSFGSYHVGDVVASQALTIANTAPTGSYTEKLDASFSAPSNSGISTSGAISLLTPEAGPSTALSVGISTATAGSKAGTVAVNFTSNGAGTSGLGNTSLGSQTVTVTGGNVYRLASANPLTTPVGLGNIHVGDGFGTQALTVQNTVVSDGFSEKLNASFGSATGEASHNGGSISLLSPGAANNSSLMVGLGGANTATAGAKSGTVAVDFVSDGTGTSGLGTTNLVSQTVTVSGGVYHYAATGFTGATLNFGNRHVGDVVANQTLSIANTAPAGSYTEKLDASFGTPSHSGITTSGSISLLTPEAGPSTALSVGISTATAGSKSGTVNVNLTANGSDTSGLPNTSLGSPTVTVSGEVFRLALANALPATINLGSISLGGAFGTQALTLQNLAANDNFSEKLTVNFGLVTGDATHNGGGISLLAPGGSDSTSLIVGLGNANTSTPGLKSGTITLSLVSDGFGTSGLGTTTLASQTITIQGTVSSGASGWTFNGSGSWNEASKWSDGVPGAAPSDTAIFGAGLTTVDGTVSLDGTSPSIGGMTFTNATHRYTIAQGSGGTLALNNGSVTVSAGDHTISAPLNLAGNATFNMVNAANDLVVSGPVSGSGGLTKSGAGTLALNSANTYAGGTTIDAGQITLGDASGLGSGGLTMNGGTLQFSLDDATVSLAQLSGTAGTIQYTPAGNRPATLTVGADNTSTSFAGVITDPGNGLRDLALVKNGAGTLTLAGANAYHGSTTISAGALNVQHNSALGDASAGTTVASGAALELENNVTITGEALTLNGAGIANGGALRNVAGNNTSSGAITLGSAARINSDAGLLTLNSTTPISGAFALTVGGAGDTAISSGITTGPLTKDGSGVLTLSAANAYAGTVTIDAGTLRLGANGVINDAGSVLVNSGGTFDLNGFNETIASLTGAGNVTLGGGTLTVANAADTTFSGGMINSNGSFRKRGTGKLTLNGTHSYSGPTQVQAGTLALGATAAINSSSLIQVDSGSTLDVTAKGAAGLVLSAGQTLRGSGQVLGNLTVGNGATISPGNSPGPTTNTGSETWASGGGYLWEIDDAFGTAGGDPGWDLLTVTGTLTITATPSNPFTIDIDTLAHSSHLAGNAAGFVNGYYNFKIAQADSIAGFSPQKFVFDPSGFVNVGGTWSIYQQAEEVWLQVAILPEPATVTLMLSGGLVVFALRRGRLWRQRR